MLSRLGVGHATTDYTLCASDQKVPGGTAGGGDLAGGVGELLAQHWNKSFPAWSVDEEAYDPRGAALAAAAIIAMDAANLTWSVTPAGATLTGHGPES